MAFRVANITAHTMKFNSAASGDFVYLYEKIVDDEIKSQRNGVKHKTFAPSQMRCDRISWFRLRGVEPDKIDVADYTLDFSAKIGTACHEMIQERLSSSSEVIWMKVSDWLSYHGCLKDWTVKSEHLEQQIESTDPFPIRFACDGLIKFQDKVYLLEIKTSDFASFQELTEPKPKHMDQIRCYATLLGVSNVLVLYMDRTYGSIKCFEIVISDAEMQGVKDKMQRVMDMVEAQIAPDKLPKGDPDCNSNMCPYYQKCKSW